MARSRKQELADIFRERELEQEEQFGRKRSKIFGGRKSAREERRDIKNKLNEMIYDNNFEEVDE